MGRNSIKRLRVSDNSDKKHILMMDFCYPKEHQLFMIISLCYNTMVQ